MKCSCEFDIELASGEEYTSDFLLCFEIRQTILNAKWISLEFS